MLLALILVSACPSSLHRTNSLSHQPNTPPHNTSLQSNRYSAWDFSRIDVQPASRKHRSLPMPEGEIALHLRGGAIIPMQEPALVTRDVRMSPITLVVAVPLLPCTGSASVTGAVTAALPPYALEEACADMYSRNLGQLVSCGYIFMDSGDELEITDQNSVQVRACV